VTSTFSLSVSSYICIKKFYRIGPCCENLEIRLSNFFLCFSQNECSAKRGRRRMSSSTKTARSYGKNELSLIFFY